MKKTAFILIMTLTALTTVAFGSQTSNVERAKAERSCAFERADSEQSAKRAERLYRKLCHLDNRPAAPEKKASAASENKAGVAKVWVSGYWKDVKVQRKVVNVKNTLGRGASSGPAVRRK